MEGKEVKKDLCCIKQNNAAVDILWYYFYFQQISWVFRVFFIAFLVRIRLYQKCTKCHLLFFYARHCTLRFEVLFLFSISLVLGLRKCVFFWLFVFYCNKQNWERKIVTFCTLIVNSIILRYLIKPGRFGSVEAHPDLDGKVLGSYTLYNIQWTSRQKCIIQRAGCLIR